MTPFPPVTLALFLDDALATPATIDASFMDSARLAAQRGTCDRLRVGCYLVVGAWPGRAECGVVCVDGANGAPDGMPKCAGVAHGIRPGDPDSCRQALHAEADAVARAARAGVRVHGGTAYVTHRPCFACASLLYAAGIARVVYAEDHKNDPRVDDFAALGMAIEKFVAP